MFGTGGKTPFEVMGRPQPGRQEDAARLDAAISNPASKQASNPANTDAVDKAVQARASALASRQSTAKDTFESATAQSSAAEAAVQQSAGAGGLASLLASGGRPIALFIPRGIAILAVAGILLMIFLAFFIGRVAGEKAGRTLGREEAKAVYGRNMAGFSNGSTAGVNGGSENEGSSSSLYLQGGNASVANTNLAADAPPAIYGQGRLWELQDGDPRQPGVNYCLVGLFNEKDVSNIARYLAGRRLDVAVVPHKNGRLFRVAVISAALPSGVPEFSDKQRYVEQEILRMLRAYATESGEKLSMAQIYMWEKFPG